MGMGSFRVHRRSLRVAIRARLTAHKLAASLVCYGLHPQSVEPQHLKLVLVLDLHLLHFRRIGKAMIQWHTLVAERRCSILVKSNDHNVLSFLTDFYNMRVHARDGSRVL